VVDGKEGENRTETNHQRIFPFLSLPLAASVIKFVFASIFLLPNKRSNFSKREEFGDRRSCEKWNLKREDFLHPKNLRG